MRQWQAVIPWLVLALVVLAGVHGFRWATEAPFAAPVPASAPAATFPPEVITALSTLVAPTPPLTPEPLAVWIADAPLPTALPTPLPATATIVAQQTAIAQAAKTATAQAQPRDCASTAPGRECLWPTWTPTPAPTWTPIPRCETPVPGARCIK